MGHPGQERPHGRQLLGLPQGLLRLRALGNVAEAPHAAHRLPVLPLGDGVALEDPAVPELQDVEGLGLRLRVQLTDLPKELLRRLELVQDVGQQLVVVPGLHEAGRDAPELAPLAPV